jgi:hypothetical protein
MAKGANHQGIFMENGSAGFLSDLVFNGGKLGMWIGNQQFAFRNITVNDAETAVTIGWDWVWTFKDLNINNCGVGVDMSAGGDGKQLVGSVTIMDAVIRNTPIGIVTATSATSQPAAGGSLILDNVHVQNVGTIVKSTSGNSLLDGPAQGEATIDSWGQGRMYMDSTGRGSFVQGPLKKPTKSAALLRSGTETFFARPKPQYENYAVSDFISVKSLGAKGDGRTDDTAAIQQALNQNAGCKIIYFPAGFYLITSTVLVPAGSRLVGEAWSVLAATGAAFQDISSPKPVFKIGNAGDEGLVEISDLVFST